MIVAACTFQVDPQSRSRSIASVISAIACAGEHQPAPDLIVLPDCFSDIPGAPAAPHVSAAMCIGFRETIARAAREWGVWIAAGHARVMPDGIVPGASVFDPDGDAWLRYPPPANDAVTEKTTTSAWSRRPTPLGHWALRRASAINGGAFERVADSADLAIIPAAPGSVRFSLDQLSAAAAASDCAVCVAQAQLANEPSLGHSSIVAAVVSRTGDVLANAENAAVGLAIAEVDVPACAPAVYLEDIEHIE